MYCKLTVRIEKTKSFGKDIKIFLKIWIKEKKKSIKKKIADGADVAQ